ncbi:sensor histidine kinase [Natrarchaeobius oligotrophus]|uniref:histidine kinase n=1 Tax=Natrarchaeobius chitinivorans TaxID=1679083 RepID=A0A3N6MKL0_NATCH|nr:PAS domain-containing sensor histidine kinase [Natrarchaeobius chitinivorans]RQH01925.1 PAS domain-containing sensor histidine kinase [Natrarchaeobius chitinivorans]
MSFRYRRAAERIRKRAVSLVGTFVLALAVGYAAITSSSRPMLALELAVPAATGCVLLWYGRRFESGPNERRRATVVASWAVGGGLVAVSTVAWSAILSGLGSAGSVGASGPLLATVFSVGVGGGTTVGHLVTERSRDRREAERLAAAIDTAMDGIAVVVDGEHVFVNDAYASLYGVRSADALEGRRWEELYADESLATIEREALSALSRRGCWQGTVTGTRVDGTTFQQEVTMTARDRAEGYVVVARDVTARLDREQRIQVLNRVLRHNLRNAFTVVRGHANLIAERAPALEDRHVEPIREEIDELLATADKARSVERRLEGRERTKPIEPTDAVRSVAERANAAYPSVRIVSRTEAVGGESIATPVDGAVVDALNELVDNAVEHRGDRPESTRTDAASVDDRDPPTVEVGVRTAGDRLEFTVADDGDGIPESERNAVLDGEETQLVHGSGLGLWFVNWIAASAGGEVRFADRSSGGTIVTLSFPRGSDDRSERNWPQPSGGEGVAADGTAR